MPFALEQIDVIAKRMLFAVQEYSIFCWEAVVSLFRQPRYWGDILTQADLIGVGSLPIVVLLRPPCVSAAWASEGDVGSGIRGEER